MSYFSFGNKKIDKSIAIFNITPVSTCLGKTIWCENHCYALKAQRQYKQTRAARSRNFDESKLDRFVEDVYRQILLFKHKVTAIRIHESGDFYSQEYLNKWVEIAVKLSSMSFYAYTKSYMLDFSSIPTNLTIIYSRDDSTQRGCRAIKNKAVVINSIKEKPKGYFACWSGPRKSYKKCGPCRYCFDLDIKTKKIAFLKH